MSNPAVPAAPAATVSAGPAAIVSSCYKYSRVLGNSWFYRNAILQKSFTDFVEIKQFCSVLGNLKQRAKSSGEVLNNLKR